MATPVGGIPRSNPSPREAQLLAQILEVVPGGIVQVGADGAILRANRQAQRVLGLSWDTLSSRFITDFAGETYLEDGSICPVELYPVSACLMTGEPQPPLTIGVQQPAGDLRWAIFTALPFPDPRDGRLGAVVTFVDITDRKREEVQARAHGRLLDTVRMVHLRDDPGATVAVFHEPLSSFLELTRSRFGFVASIDGSVAEPDELILHAVIDEDAVRGGTQEPPVPIDPLSQRAVREGRAVIEEAPGAPGGAFRRRSLERAALLPLRAGDEIVGVVGLADAPHAYTRAGLTELTPLLEACADLVTALSDRRNRRQLEAQLAQAERLASVGTLAAGMAHEINNPLAYVLLNLEGLARATAKLEGGLDGLDAPAETRALVRRLGDHGADAQEGAERVQRIVRDLMTFSRVSEEDERLVDVNGAIEVALKMSNHEIRYRARLVRELTPIDPVLGNDGRLSQVFLNLLLNAARAIEEGLPDDNEIRVASWMEGDDVKVAMRDTGAGVDPAHMDRLFEPFFSTRTPGAGAGLGLSICHNVVRAHGGRIDVESHLGRGTRFVVTLPRATATVTSLPPAPPPVIPGEPARAHMLLIDDEPMVRRVLSQLLSRRYEVTAADGLESAIAALERGPDPDVVLCDMMMLDGTGVDVHAWARERRPELAERMIFMTGGTFTPKAREFLADVAAHHLTKPFSLSELDSLVLKLLA